MLTDEVNIGKDTVRKSVVEIDVWLTVHRSSVWNKKPTGCHLVLYLFLLYKLLNMFRATLCPSSGADDLVVMFAACGVDISGNNTAHYTTRGKNSSKSSAPE